MIDYKLFIPILASFFVTLFLLPFWIRKAKQIDLQWDDVNKLHSEKVSGSGGIIVIIGFSLGLLLFIAYRVFILQNTEHLIEILAILSTVLMLAGIGLVDDLLGWRKGGLSKRSRIISVAFASIPLIVINAGKDIISLPIIGIIDAGIIYPLEAGQGVLLLSALSVVAYYTNNPWLAVIGLCMIAALIAFLIFNFYPSKIFPGDIMTYSIGGSIAIMAILGNFEKIAIFFFIPIIIEFFLKSRGSFIKQSFGKPEKDGSLNLKYNGIYGLTHLSIYSMKKLNIIPTEKRVVYSIWAFQLLIIIIGFLIFGKGIF